MKDRVQKMGRFLSGMVMPNIGAFIAWGIITALFIPDGWIPNEAFAAIVGPMLTYVLPVLIGYTGGYTISGQRGAVVGAIATIGVIVGAPDTPMFLGAMLAGPLGGVCIKWFDKAMDGKIPAGFEMLINNFSSGIIGTILALLGLVAINPVCLVITNGLSAGVGFLVEHGLLPLTAIFVEPAKVLFLNNAINHGIFTPLGIEQVSQIGKSIFYMIESNPGPGLGLLLAYCVFGKGSSKSSAPGAAVIHFLGGIHEIYFPYVLMNPVVILGPMAGNMCGIFILQLLGGGLSGAASPGSIIAEIMMTPKGSFVANILGIIVSIVVSFLLSSVLLKLFAKDGDLEEAQKKTSDMKAESKGVTGEKSNKDVPYSQVKKIAFACDAGMGSSAMGATMLRKKLKAAGIDDIQVIHSSVSEIPKNVQVIVTHVELKQRAKDANSNARLVLITNFMSAPEYDTLVKNLVDARKTPVKI